MKLNIGCGFNKKSGYVNIDKFAECLPDLKMDAEIIPWQFKDNAVEEVVFYHSLEHMGADANLFLAIIKELYRVCKPGAIIQINVPHPRHDDFINDPTHVRIITPELLKLFSKKQNLLWKEQGYSSTTLALYIDVDFETLATNYFVEEKYIHLLNSNKITENDMWAMSQERNNVIKEIGITLQVVK